MKRDDLPGPILGRYVDDRFEEGIFRLHPAVYSDPELFEMEMKYIFERTWIFLAIESQIRQPHDFVTTQIGRTPVLVTRDAKGGIGVFINACRHKGATVARMSEGNARYHVCPYHGWAYDSAGKNVDIKDRKAGCYAPAFDADNHDLLPIARVASYRGLIFGSLSADVPPLEEHLGDMRFFIDLVMDQGEHGMEFIPGRSTYTFRGNWKLQMDNGTDPYHVTSTHVSMIDIQQRRARGQGNVDAKQNDFSKVKGLSQGMFIFPRGHALLWVDQPEPHKRPIYPNIEKIKARVGELRAQWMLKLRNTQFFPNMQISEVNALMLRTFQPLSVNLTEMRSFGLAPIGEAPELRAWRLRQFEDFFNASGFATPDDTVLYEECQTGLGIRDLPWLQGCERGMGIIQRGADEVARSLGVHPTHSIMSEAHLNPEMAFHATYREWARLLEAGITGER
jgi:benzoate/toluate 1,2-dioxygenase subunit alpha